jgi:hypothetical protein
MPLRAKRGNLNSLSPDGGRVGRHPARIYSRWDMGKEIVRVRVISYYSIATTQMQSMTNKMVKPMVNWSRLFSTPRRVR